MTEAEARGLDNALRERFKAVKDAPAQAPKASKRAVKSAAPAKRVSAPSKIKVEAVEALPQAFRVAVYEGTTQVAVYPVNRKGSKFLTLSDRLWRTMVKYAQAHKAADLVVVYAGPVAVSVEGTEYEPGASVVRARTHDLLADTYDD